MGEPFSFYSGGIYIYSKNGYLTYKPWYVLNSSAKMPHKVKVPYKNIAVVASKNPTKRPNKIDSRYVHIAQAWYRCHLGNNPKGNTEAELALNEAYELMNKLNGNT
jgi:hypothetical protein